MQKSVLPAILLQTQCWSSYFSQNVLPPARIKQQKRNRCASHWPWQHSCGPNTTIYQQSCGTSINSSKTIANSQCKFILVDCCLIASFSDSAIITPPPWPCWPWQLRFWDGSRSNPTDTRQINQLERKLNSDITRFHSFDLFFIECRLLNAMAGKDDVWPEALLLFPPVGYSAICNFPRREEELMIEHVSHKGSTS
jgi:hypothetical protein